MSAERGRPLNSTRSTSNSARGAAALALAATLLGSWGGLWAQGYTPHRVFEAGRNRFADFEAMAADLATADVVLLGEQHDDPATHRLQLAVLEGLARRRGQIVLSLEMFERDVQEPLDHFQMGHTPEAEFLAEARPWPRYATDYKPLVDLAIAQKWPVVAANVPRPVASAVAKGGLAVLADRPESERAWQASDRQCAATGDYFERFVQAMGGHPADSAKESDDAKAREARASSERYYASQCLKDETMAESIAQAVVAGSRGGKRPLVVHVNGAFHSDFRQGTTERVARRLPTHRIVAVTFVPVKDLDRVTAPDRRERRRADYLVYTLTAK